MQVVRNAAGILLSVIQWIIIARVILSWFPLARNNPLVVFIFQITEPILAPIRRMLEKTPLGGGMMLDLSPFIVILLANLIKNLVL